ncbi:MAG: hypothetical protein NVSMB62_21650 [Acidobacteriaceae bacterium]
MSSVPRTGIGAAVVPAYLDESGEAIARLQGWYNTQTGLYETTGWWNSANATTVLIDYSRVTKTKKYDSVIAHTFATAPKKFPKFLNQYYDDEGWWALAWIDAYDHTHRPEYLAMAKTIFEDMAGGWDETCHGGIWWSKERSYKNAIANELFLSVAAHLGNRSHGAERASYKRWSDKEWAWFGRSGMINSDGLINDGLTQQTDASGGSHCVNNRRTTWTYNQGVVLGGLAELSTLDGNPSYRQQAESIAKAAIAKLATTDHILHDPCEPKCGADGVQFKGIFVRNLALLQQDHPDGSVKDFVDTNAASIWKNARGPEGELDTVWSGPFTQANAASQSSALDALIAAALLERTKPSSQSVR